MWHKVHKFTILDNICFLHQYFINFFPNHSLWKWLWQYFFSSLSLSFLSNEWLSVLDLMGQIDQPTYTWYVVWAIFFVFDWYWYITLEHEVLVCYLENHFFFFNGWRITFKF
jgi:hypothetical protein